MISNSTIHDLLFNNMLPSQIILSINSYLTIFFAWTMSVSTHRVAIKFDSSLSLPVMEPWLIYIQYPPTRSSPYQMTFSLLLLDALLDYLFSFSESPTAAAFVALRMTDFTWNTAKKPHQPDDMTICGTNSNHGLTTFICTMSRKNNSMRQVMPST